jgi:phosphoadenosine phosphosulfate reductase
MIFGYAEDHVEHSIALLKEHEPPEGYYLAFSGGKDSIVCYHLCKQAGVKFDAHYMRALEPREVVYFIRREYSDVIRHLPKKTFYQLIREHGIPPLRTIRYCCATLKEIGGKGRTVIVGIRAAESQTRRMRQEVAEIRKKKMISPILTWTDKQVWDCIKYNNLKYPDLYDKGFKRIGCVMCPCAGGKTMKQEARLYPKEAEAIRRACVRAFDPAIATSWRDGNDMYKWWLSGKGFGHNQKPVLFDDIYY